LCTTGIAYFIGIYRYQTEGKNFVSIDVYLTGSGETFYLKENVYRSSECVPVHPFDGIDTT
jgi:hypothetical protein